MPELGEVEIVRRNLESWWLGESADEVCLLDAEKLLVRGEPETLEDALKSELEEIRRRGKYLIAHFANEHDVVFHFRMTGKIIDEAGPDVDYARLAWHLPSCEWLVFKDSRRLGTVEIFGPGELDDYEPLQEMGPEPYDVDGESLRDQIGNRKMKNALLDQSVIAGVGNIAISELFWRLGLPPNVHASELEQEDFDRLADQMPAFFDDVIERQMSDEVVYLEEGADTNPFDVYGREGEGCPACGTEIERTKVAGRSTYFCPDCQS